MPYVRYTAAQKAEAVALARVIGAEEAADQLSLDARAVRRWMQANGDTAEMGPDPGTWRSLMDLALSRVTVAVANGKLAPTTVATIAGIAARNAHRDAPAATAEPLAVDVHETFADWVIDQMPEADLADLDAAEAAIGSLLRALLRAANAEPGQPHRRAILTWHSGRREFGGDPITAGDLLPWAQALTSKWMTPHGLVAWAVATEADLARERAEEAERVAALMPAPPPVPPVGADLAELLAAADALLSEMR